MMPVNTFSPKLRCRVFCLFLLWGGLLFTKQAEGQPGPFRIITDDVTHFWEAVDSLPSTSDTTALFQRLVIDRASDEFQVFIKKWKIRAANYTYQLRRFPRFYKTLRASSLKLIRSGDSIRHLVAKFESRYPGFRPADICIGFGNFSTGGNIALEKDRNLVYIGLEFHAPDDSTELRELPASLQDYVSRSHFFRTVIHELVHVQHRTHGPKFAKTLTGDWLAHRILSEGIPDFIARLIVPQGNNGHYVEYGMKNEASLRAKLKEELYRTGSGDWFGGDDSLFVNHPRDLGYFMGSRIAESYYRNHPQAVTDLTGLIEIRSLEKFIAASKYFD